jgi:signal transduction histidine kinase/ActR/RegA family two-component response regulator
MISSFFGRLSIRHKLVTLFMLISATVMVLGSIAFVLWDYVQFQSDMRRELSVQARIVLDNSTAAMSFQDQSAARETLETLTPNAGVQLACLYDAAGSLFSEFRRAEAGGPCPPVTPPDGYTFSANRLVPVDELAKTARDISERGDYSLRARKIHPDELGMLVDTFNGMLEQIQQVQDDRTELLHRERAANRMKDEFLMTLSHELRTPLNAILGWTKMLTENAVPPEGMQSALRRIDRNAQLQARLVDDLLEVSRFTTGKVTLQKATIDLSAVLTHAIEAIRPQADARSVAIEPRVSPSTLYTWGDPDRLQQVVWNLLSNAVKFSLPGGRVLVNLRREGAIDELTVADAGLGIEPEFLPHVFEPFRQGDASSTREHGGLGLGLSIVRRIVEMHGGEVLAASPGRGLGATFTVRLPVAVAEWASPVQPQPRDMPASNRNGLHGLHVLVVDDDADVRELLRTLLGGWGADVEVAASAAEALQLAGERAPDVLISDISMPRQDGYLLLDRLRELLGSSMPPVTIALTAQAGPDNQRRALEAGFLRHVAKPFDPVALAQMLIELRHSSNAGS